MPRPPSPADSDEDEPVAFSGSLRPPSAAVSRSGGGGGGGGGSPQRPPLPAGALAAGARAPRPPAAAPNPGLSGVPPAALAYAPPASGALPARLPDEVTALFAHIAAYTVEAVLLDTPLRCFIPDYVPAVGEMDCFVKPPRPDGQPDASGIDFLDEPGAEQSDATTLELQLRAASRRAASEPARVRSIEHADVPREVGRWIASVAALRRAPPASAPAASPPPPPLPDMERLLRAWPPALAAALEQAPLPGAELDVALAEYARIACALLDVPTRSGALVHALHALFALYLDCSEHPALARAALPAPVG